MDLKSVACNEAYETVTAEEAIKALIRDERTLPEPIRKRLHDYQVIFNQGVAKKESISIDTVIVSNISYGLLIPLTYRIHNRSNSYVRKYSWNSEMDMVYSMIYNRKR